MGTKRLGATFPAKVDSTSNKAKSKLIISSITRKNFFIVV